MFKLTHITRWSGAACVALMAGLSASANAQHIVIGYGPTPPLSFQTPDGRPAGFAIEVLNEAARREGVQLVWRLVGSSASIDRDLAAGRIDLLPAGLETPHRKSAFFVTDPWWFTELTALAREDAGIRTAADLRGKRLALATPYYRFLTARHFPSVELVVNEPPNAGATAAIMAVCAGSADAALMTHMDVHDKVLARPEPCGGVRLRAVDTDAVMPLSLVARRGMEQHARRLRRRIDELTADGTLAAIASRHPPIPTQGAVHLAERLRSQYERDLLRIWLGSSAALLALAGIFVLRQIRTKRALRRSEARYRGFFELAAAGAVQVEAETRRFIDVNEEFCRITGYSREELLVSTFAEVTHPDDRSRDAELFESLRAGAIRNYNREKRYIRKDGGNVWARVDVTGIRGPDGALLHTIGIVQDITARREAEIAMRESEQRYRLLIEANPIGVVYGGIAGDDYGRVLNANEAFLRIVEYSREDLESGRISWSDQTPPEYLPLDLEAIEQARSAGVSKVYEKQYVRKDGTRADVMVAVAATGERKEHGVAFVLEVSERKQFETQLREAQRLESIGLLAGGIAHDFNNILTAVIGNLALATADLPDDCAAKTALDRASRAADRAVDLTRQLLAYAGKGTFFRRPVDFSAMARQSVELARASVPKKIEFHEDLPAGLPRVMADPGQCQQIVMNLVLNAAEAIPEGRPGSVKVRTFADASEVCLEVTDTGTGMDERTKARMFDPFFTTKFLGRGLGLAAVQGIVRSLGGGITVETAPGCGTRMLLRLPASTEAVRAAEAKPDAPAARSGGGTTVLVADDEEAVRMFVKSVLVARGYDVLEARNGREAVDLLTENGRAVRVVILDLTMPELNGDEALDLIRRRRLDLRVIVSSGYDEREAMRAFHGREVAAFLEKPYTADRLLAHVEAALGGAPPS